MPSSTKQLVRPDRQRGIPLPVSSFKVLMWSAMT